MKKKNVLEDRKIKQIEKKNENKNKKVWNRYKERRIPIMKMQIKNQ